MAFQTFILCKAFLKANCLPDMVLTKIAKYDFVDKYKNDLICIFFIICTEDGQAEVLTEIFAESSSYFFFFFL